jgi:hypothetical protein
VLAGEGLHLWHAHQTWSPIKEMPGFCTPRLRQQIQCRSALARRCRCTGNSLSFGWKNITALGLHPQPTGWDSDLQESTFTGYRRHMLAA